MKGCYAYCLAFSFHSHIVSCSKHIHVMNVKRDGFVLTTGLILVLREIINYFSSFFIVLVQFCVQYEKFFHPGDGHIPYWPHLPSVRTCDILSGDDQNMKCVL